MTDISELCLEQLAAVTEGRLRLGTMPPLAGTLEPVRRIVLDIAHVHPSDVFWQLGSRNGMALVEVQQAFCRGALGAVVEWPGIEPWAGKFVLEVRDSAAALERVLQAWGDVKRFSHTLHELATCRRRVSASASARV
jgi:hypothetical protein